MIRTPMSASKFPGVIGIGGSPKEGKTRFALSCIRGAPEEFGPKGIYVQIDPDGAGSALTEDRPNWEVVIPDPKKELKDELGAVITHPWHKEGIKTVVIDTGSIACKRMLNDLSRHKLFGQNVDLGGVYQATQGDYSGVSNQYFKLLNAQLDQFNMYGTRFITNYHNLEVRPDSGTPGEVKGGPKGAGKAMTADIISWYNCYMRIALDPLPRGGDLSAPRKFERRLYTATAGIWEAGLRTAHKENPHPYFVVGTDPAGVWGNLVNLFKENSNG